MTSLTHLLRPPSTCDVMYTPSTFTLAQAKQSLTDNGLVILRGFISDLSLQEAAKGVAEVIREDYLAKVPTNLIPAPTDNPFEYDYLRSPTYGRGNASFGFLFTQPATWDRAKLPTISLSAGDIYLERMGAYVKGNLRLISHTDNQLAMAALFALTNPTGMVSFDSVKVCDYKTRATELAGVRIVPTKRKHTPAHFDLYPAGDINRVQAMIFGAEEGDVTLCFGRYTHLGPTQNAIAAIENNADLFSRVGFVQTSNPAVLQALRDSDAIVVPLPGDLVIWKAGVLHMELDRHTRDIPNLRKVKDGRSLRFVVGTNRPAHLSEEDKKQLASAALQGLVPHPYISSPGRAYANVVCRKTTMYKKLPKYPLDTAVVHSQSLEGYSARLLHCLGLTKDVDELYDDPQALSVA